MPDPGAGRVRVVVVGGGFARVGCAKRLARDDRIHVTLIDRNNYHQFQPRLYQVATSQVAASNIAFSLRMLFRDRRNAAVKMAEVAELDPATRTAIATDGERRTGDALVVAAGSKPNFFHTAGADEHAFPLYSLPDAERLRSRIIGAFEAADRNPALIDRRASRDPRRRVDDPHALCSSGAAGSWPRRSRAPTPSRTGTAAGSRSVRT